MRVADGLYDNRSMKNSLFSCGTRAVTKFGRLSHENWGYPNQRSQHYFLTIKWIHTKASRTIALQDARSSSTPTVRIITGRSQFHHLTPNGNVYLENYTSQYMHTAHIFNGKERFKNLFSPCTQARKYKLFPAP